MTDLWDQASPFVVERTVSAREIDGLGHVNNVHYLQWLEECAWAHSAARGFDVGAMHALGCAMVVRESRMQYLQATFESDRLLVGDWITRCDGRLRATRTFQIVRPADGTTVMRAQIDYVCINIASGRPTRMPPEFVEAYRVGV